MGVYGRMLVPQETRSRSAETLAYTSTWTPIVCKIIAFMAVIMGLRLSFYILLGFRSTPQCVVAVLCQLACKSFALANEVTL